MSQTKAKESAKVRKYRRKLQKQMEEENASFNAESLAKVKATIQEWIVRHQNARVNLRDKTITLFDENKHPAPVESKFIQKLFADLRRTGGSFKTDSQDQ